MTKSYAPTHTKNSQLCSVSKAFLPYHTKKNYQLFSYWFLLNSCEWSYSINYIVFFFPYISSLKDFLFELLIYVLFESMGLTRNCVCLSYSLGLNRDFEENYISSTIKHLQWRRKMPVIRTVKRNLQFKWSYLQVNNWVMKVKTRLPEEQDI